MTTLDTYDNGYAPTRERFERDTADHNPHFVWACLGIVWAINAYRKAAS